ncbi:peptidoglycan DD-metalloendopeptidase family protein [Marinobacterium sp. MBR-109]|uniref:peptidoglycan DD-metalloendopeptidase family protein n=1 Tax=Marinobacterium sp. MBR-109 TaxID=3156462 RepID=UPI0033977306
MPNPLLLWLISLMLLLQGCSSGYAPVSERSMGARSEARGPAPASYRVQRGDTLYSISFRYGLDYREVARWNSIDSRYFIYPGQTLKLRPNSGSKVSAASSTAASKPPSTAVAASAETARPAANPNRSATTARTSSSSPPSASAGGTGPVSWQWPHKGRIISRFGGGEPANKGLDIAGNAGEPVKAAAGGEVVYAGNGLLGYGNLVIINHNQRYLSAYAHNSRIFVREGDKVKAGEKIAEIGNTGATRTMLHFEIRRDGNPVDPLRYLPKQ